VTTFDEAIDRIRPLASSIVERMQKIDVTPSEIEVKFGLNFTAEAGVLISASTEANFEFKLTWKPEKPAKNSAAQSRVDE
jgi:hypothetical protein